MLSRRIRAVSESLTLALNARAKAIKAKGVDVIPSPFWLSYSEMALLAEGKPVLVETDAARGFALDAARLEAAFTERTRVLVLNSPGNPTGAVYDADQLRAIADVVRRHPHVTI